MPVQFGAITASNSTRGHRFLAPASLTITQPDAYEDTLKKAHVIADRELRKAMIHQAVTALAQQHGLVWREDMGLLEEVTGLVEWPVALSGRIDAKFMDLPPEVLVSEMRAHQKYFALTDASGTLADRFILIANMQPTDNGAAIVAGHERVLRARLSDGRFFWDQDRKKTLQAWGEGLASVTFHAKLGSIADKVSRINALAAKLAAYIPGTDAGLVARAAALCKADLVTGMVGEFPDLQGVMGRYYALAQQEPAPVADAIRDHYKPLGPTDAVPSAPVSVCIALADKLDTLISMFAIGEKPTGSKDPFALRRAALGVIRMVLENKLCMPLKAIGLNDELLAFFYDRLKVQLKDQGIRHDVINAVVAKGDDDLLRIVARAQALQQFLASDDGANLLIAYKRASNILAIEEKKDKATYAAFALSEFDTLHLEAREEIALKNHMSQLHADLKNPLEKEDYNTAMQLLARLRHPVDVFFDKVMVNAEDKSLRQHRLRMLASIRGSMDNIANFALIEG